MIQALIFDFDGLILDTEVPDFASWQEVYDTFGCSLPFDDWAACIGTHSGAFDVYSCLERQLGREIDREAVRAQRRLRYREMVAAQAVLPGVEAYLADAARLGLKLAVASSSDRAWVTGHLTRLGLMERFQCVRCAEDVRQIKPDPELYRAALAALGLEPHQAVALEDSPNGVLAAKRAGLFCVAVPNALTRRLALEHADLQVSSLAELPLARLLAAVGASGPRASGG
jgi:HAD superfamily hydrolase (TIGR01509 family)